MVQRVATQIFFGQEDGRIAGLAIVGRPPSPHSGTMGDHTTAFTTIASGIVTQLTGKTVHEASAFLAGLTNGLHQLPGMQFFDTLPQEHKEKLHSALNKVHGFLQDLRKFRKNYRRQEIGLFNIPQNEQHEYEYSAGLITHMQDWVDTYLEARELVPMSTVNVKAIEAPLAGKGKGESANLLVTAEKNQQVNPFELINTVLGLFDARAAAIICSTTDPELLKKVAPGVPPDMHPDDRAVSIVRQHLITIKSLYPATYRNLERNGMANKSFIEFVEGQLHMNLRQKMKENGEAQHTENKKKKKGGKRVPIEGKRYLTSALSVNENDVITDVRTGGRGTSPYSNTMGAHTTAWIVLTDSISADLVGKTLLEGAEALEALIGNAISQMIKMSGLMQADEKQIHRIFAALDPLKESQTRLTELVYRKNFEAKQKQQVETISVNRDKMDVQEEGMEDGFPESFTWYSPWEQMLIMQEAITNLLNYMNLTPGATLFVGNVNGAREGAYRGVLRQNFHPRRQQNYNPDQALVRKAILGLLDLKGLDEHLSTTKENLHFVPKHKYDPFAFANLPPEEIEKKSLYSQFYQSVGKDQPQGSNEDAVVEELVKHHFALIEKAYPGALKYAQLSLDQNLVQLARESLLYSTDEEFEFEDESDDEEFD